MDRIIGNSALCPCMSPARIHAPLPIIHTNAVYNLLLPPFAFGCRPTSIIYHHLRCVAALINTFFPTLPERGVPPILHPCRPRTTHEVRHQRNADIHSGRTAHHPRKNPAFHGGPPHHVLHHTPEGHPLAAHRKSNGQPQLLAVLVDWLPA